MAVAQLTEGHRTELAMTYAASQLGVPHSLSASALGLCAFICNDS